MNPLFARISSVVLLAFFSVLFPVRFVSALVPTPADVRSWPINPCYIFNPTLGTEINLLIRSGGKEKRVLIPKVAPPLAPSILHTIFWTPTSDDCARQWGRIGNEPFSMYLWDIGLLVGGNQMIWSPLDDASLVSSVGSSGGGGHQHLGRAQYSFVDVTGNTHEEMIQHEDALVAAIDSTKTLTAATIIYHKNTGRRSSTLKLTAPATNCAQLSGTGSKKIVFMRGKSWSSGIEDFLWQASAVKDRMLAAEPFKTFKNDFSFYIDLKKQEGASSASSCGEDAFRYIIFISVPANDSENIVLSNQKDVFVNVSKTDLFNEAAVNSTSRLTLQGLGSSIGGLYKEKFTHGSRGVVPTPTRNCTNDVYEDFRISETNRMYGAVDAVGCGGFEISSTNGKPYYRSSEKSLMGDGDKFDLVSCGYLIAGIKGEALTKENAEKHWPQCEKLDLAKGGIPPHLPAPLVKNINEILIEQGSEGNIYKTTDQMAISQGSSVEVSGSGFTEKGNAVRLKTIPDASLGNEIKTYDINGISLKEDILYFSIPSNFPVGVYDIEAGALNSDWSAKKKIHVHGAGPSNLTARSVFIDEVSLSWSDNSPDEEEFLLFRFSGDLAEIKKEIGRADVYAALYNGPTIDDSGMHMSEPLGRNPKVYLAVIPIEKNKTTYVDKIKKEYLVGSNTLVYTIGARYKSISGGNENSRGSNTAEVIATVKPEAPVLTAKAISDSEIELSWDNGTMHAGPATIYIPADESIQEYILSQDVKVSFDDIDSPSNYSLDSPKKIIARTKDTELILKKLPPYTLFCFSVQASAGNGNISDESNRECATTFKKDQTKEIEPSLESDASQSFSSVSGETSFNLNSVPPGTVSAELFFDGRRVSSVNSSPWRLPFNSMNFSNGSYNAYARINRGGNKQPILTAPVRITVNNKANPPAAPSSTIVLTARENAGEVNLSWNDPFSNETGFVVQTIVNNQLLKNDNLPVNMTSFVSKGLQPSQQYRYRVKAVFSNGDTSYSNIVSATTSASAASGTPPVNLIINLTGRAEKRGEVQLNWTTNWNTKNDRGDTFVVKAYFNGKSVAEYPLPHQFSFPVPLLEPAKEYGFEVCTISTPKNCSQRISVKTLPKLLAPTLTAVGQGSGTVLLVWNDPNGTDVREYKVFKIVTGQATILAGNVQKKAFEVKGLGRGTFCFKVQGYVNPSNYSDMSNEACANPAQVSAVPAVEPKATSTSVVNLTVKWITSLLPKPQPTAIPAPSPISVRNTQSSVTISGSPVTLPGDTRDLFIIPAGISRSITVKNSTNQDFNLNKNPSAAYIYTANPSSLPGDTASIFVVPAGTERTFEYRTVSTRDAYISKTSLIISGGNSSSILSATPHASITPRRTSPTPIVVPSATPYPTRTPSPSATAIPSSAASPSPTPFYYYSPAPSTTASPAATPYYSSPSPSTTIRTSTSASPTPTPYYSSSPSVSASPTPVYNYSSASPSPTQVYYSPTPTPSSSASPSPSPSSSPSSSPTTSSSPTPTSSPVSKGNRTVLAAILYAIGDFLDALSR